MAAGLRVGPVAVAVCVIVAVAAVLVVPVLFFSSVANQATSGYLPATIPVVELGGDTTSAPVIGAMDVEVFPQPDVKDAYYARDDARDAVLAVVALTVAVVAVCTALGRPFSRWSVAALLLVAVACVAAGIIGPELSAWAQREVVALADLPTTVAQARTADLPYVVELDEVTWQKHYFVAGAFAALAACWMLSLRRVLSRAIGG